MIKKIIFDLDNTLIDWQDSYYNFAIENACKDLSLISRNNEILKLENKKPLYTRNQEGKVLIFNRSFSVLVAIGFLIINMIEKSNDPNDNVQNTKHTNLQIDASIFNLISSLIVLYVAYDSINNITAADITNPEL